MRTSTFPVQPANRAARPSDSSAAPSPGDRATRRRGSTSRNPSRNVKLACPQLSSFHSKVYLKEIIRPTCQDLQTWTLLAVWVPTARCRTWP